MGARGEIETTTRMQGRTSRRPARRVGALPGPLDIALLVIIVLVGAGGVAFAEPTAAAATSAAGELAAAGA